MAVFKVHKSKNYTVMSNHHLKDKNLSLKAKGLLSVMLSLPANWDYSVLGLVAICKENKTSMQGVLKELEEYRYLERNRIQNKKGQFEYVYNIYECPQIKPCTEKPCTDNPCTENVPQYNTNILNINKLNTNNIYEQEFENLWKLYPNKKGKTNALKSYIKARKKGINYEDIYKGIINYLDYIKIHNTKEQYIKHGSTWFNQECWNDTYSANKDVPNWFLKEIKDEELSEEERIKYIQEFN